MPYVTIPKDFTKVKKKIVMGMTKRQLIAIAAAGALCLPIYFFLTPIIGDWALYLILLLAVPLFLFGFYTGKDGRTPESMLLNYIQVRYRRPKIRVYQVANLYEKVAIIQEIEEVISDGAAAKAKSDENKTVGSLRRFTKSHKKKSHSAGEAGKA